MSKRLIDKALEAARETIRKQEGYGAVVRDWRLIKIRSIHQVVVSVMIMANEFGPFDIWVTIDLETEDVTVQE